MGADEHESRFSTFGSPYKKTRKVSSSVIHSQKPTESKLLETSFRINKLSSLFSVCFALGRMENKKSYIH